MNKTEPQPTTPKEQKPRAYLLLLINAILWGISPAIIKIGIEEISPFVFLYYRHLICSVFILFYLIITKKVKPSLKVFTKPINLITMFILTPGVLIIQFIAIKITDNIIASIVSAFTPLIGNLIGGIFLKENITKKEKLGTFFAFLGILWLIFVQSQTEITFILQDNIIGTSLLIFASIIWIIGNILFQKIPEEEQDLVSLNSFFLSIALFAGIFLISNPSLIVPQVPSLKTSLSVGYMAIFGSLVAFLAYQEASKHVEVSESSVFTYLQPVFGIPASVILLGQRFILEMIYPIILIFIGMGLNVIEKFEKSNRSSTYQDFIQKITKEPKKEALNE